MESKGYQTFTRKYTCFGNVGNLCYYPDTPIEYSIYELLQKVAIVTKVTKLSFLNPPFVLNMFPKDKFSLIKLKENKQYGR